MNPIDDSDRLKPCPFCGGDAEIDAEAEASGGYFVQCLNSACGASSALIFPLMDDVKHLLIERWNRRVAGDVRRHIICICPDCAKTPNVEVQGPGAASLRTVPCNDGLGAWRPISTAPKDGTEILVYTWAGSFYVVTYDDLYSAPWRVRNDEGIAEQAPAFWQPLPKAPNG